MREFPVLPLSAIISGGAPMILAPHPDDESLGCGGLIAACCKSGITPLVMVLTDGTGSHPNSRSHPPPALRALREKETALATAHLGLRRRDIVFLRRPDRYAPTGGAEFERVVRDVARQVRQRGCTVICAPWQHDPHNDHVAAYSIGGMAARRSGARLICYPVWGWTLPGEQELQGPPPRGARLDVRRFLSVKRKAIAAHRSQHGQIIADDPDGFVLRQGMLAYFDRPFEVFLW